MVPPFAACWLPKSQPGWRLSQSPTYITSKQCYPKNLFLPNTLSRALSPKLSAIARGSPFQYSIASLPISDISIPSAYQHAALHIVSHTLHTPHSSMCFDNTLQIEVKEALMSSWVIRLLIYNCLYFRPFFNGY